MFSLNAHKAIQCGEGGVAVTNDEGLAERLRLIRNRAEVATISNSKSIGLANMLGWNYRMTELEAAIAIEQLKKLDSVNKHRQDLAMFLTKELSEIKRYNPSFC